VIPYKNLSKIDIHGHEKYGHDDQKFAGKKQYLAIIC